MLNYSIATINYYYYHHDYHLYYNWAKHNGPVSQTKDLLTMLYTDQMTVLQNENNNDNKRTYIAVYSSQSQVHHALISFF